MLPLFDTHCHLQDPRLGADLAGMMDRARDVGVAGFACCGTREDDWNSVLALAETYPDVVPLLGLHPWHVHEASPGWLGRLDVLATKHPVGIGEIGLDGAIAEPDLDTQEVAFRAQLRLARTLDRPASIHCRRAWERLIASLRAVGLPARGAVVHAYSGSAETARELQRLGCFLAFGCALTHPENHRSTKAIQAVAPEHLLLETDAPDLPPRHQGWPPDRPNESANLVLVLEAAARRLGQDPEVLAAQIQANARRIFPHRDRSRA